MKMPKYEIVIQQIDFIGHAIEMVDCTLRLKKGHPEVLELLLFLGIDAFELINVDGIVFESCPIVKTHTESRMREDDLNKLNKEEDKK
jgi:hypothetical protein